jgi:hypothetical protein
MLNDETLKEFRLYEKTGWITITPNHCFTNMGSGNVVGNSIEDKKRPYGWGNGFVITLNKTLYDNL